MNARTAGHQQRVHRRPRLRQRRGHKPQAGRSSHDRSAGGNDPGRVKLSIAARHGKFVCGRKDLQRSGDIEELHRRIRQDLNQARFLGARVWRKTRVLWHLRHSLPR